MPEQLPGYDLWKSRAPYDEACAGCRAAAYCTVSEPLGCPLNDWTDEVIIEFVAAVDGDRADEAHDEEGDHA